MEGRAITDSKEAKEVTITIKVRINANLVILATR